MTITLPDYPDLLANVGAALRQCNDFAQAEACLNRALSLNLARAESWNNRGQIHEDLGEFTEAYTAYQNAYSLKPEHPQIALALAYQRMRSGEWSNDPWLPAGAPPETAPFPGTWDLWEAGRDNYGTLPGVPIWQGEDLTGLRLLIAAEGGFGDYLWLSRYLPELDAMAAITYVAVPDSLVRLAERRFPMRHPRIVPLSELANYNTFFDYQIPLLSLLTRFLRDSRDIPSASLRRIDGSRGAQGLCGPRNVRNGPEGTLGAPPPLETQNRAGSALNSGILRVGLTPCAQENGVQRPHRSIPALALLPLRDVPGIEWISLVPDRYTDWVRPITSIKAPNGETWDWEDTAQVVEQLDIVVSVDTAICHLSGSLGIPTITLLPLRTDWKWGLQDRSVWYPEMKLIRQRHPTDWAGVVQEVCRQLTAQAVLIG